VTQCLLYIIESTYLCLFTVLQVQWIRSVSIPGYCVTTYLSHFTLDLALGSCVGDDETSKLEANSDSESESLPSSDGVSKRVAALEYL
jgi:hypothetical protein